jgi:hypothetical protein
MRRHFTPELRCAICSDPIDLTIDLCADENGEPIHEGCYVNRLIAVCSIQASVGRPVDTLPAHPPATAEPPKAGSSKIASAGVSSFLGAA